jgi:hypothetical protein
MRRMCCAAVLLLCSGFGVTHVCAQAQAKPQSASPEAQAAQAPAAKPEDVSSPDALLAAVYDVISGPAGQKRDWDRFRSMFYPGAHLVRTAAKKEGGLSAAVFTPEDYVSRASSYFEKNGFFEREIARRTEWWGNILQAFSTYESRHNAKDAAPFARGINSIQLFYDGNRWWVVTIFWQEESAQNPLTAEFLPAPR